MKLGRKLRFAVAIGAATSSLALGLIVPTTGGASVQNATITQAEAPGAAPNYIFPYYDGQYCSVANATEFQELMFRPLYYFGLGKSILLQPQLSLAKLPKYTNHNKTVTISLKGWKFADGQTVNAESVMFFLNMFKADPVFCTYIPNIGIPDQVASARAVGNSKVVITLKSSVNPNWFTYNNLSMITPMPNSWDRTSASQKSNCASGKFGATSTNVACKNVYNYLNGLASNTSTFTGSLWQSGDTGPWRLTSFDNLGNATFQPNAHYSGPQKAQVRYFKEVAFTTATAIENQLQAGNLTIGGLDPSILTQGAPAPGKTGPNWGQLSQRYRMEVAVPWSTNYDLINFGGKSPNAAFIGQDYVRQALEESIDQPGIIANAFKNYAVGDWSGLPTGTPSALSGPVPQPYPFSLSSAEALFASHGWTNQSGQLVCTSPGSGSNQCGAGIASGYKATVNFEWVSGSPSEETQNNAIVNDWNQVGVAVNHNETTFDGIFSQCPEAFVANSTYDICSWGGGWLFAPDYYPSGEPLWLTGAGSNYGNYSNATMDSLIKATLSENVKLTAYAKFTASNIPVLWVPNTAGIGEVSKSLKSSIGFAPNPLEEFTPEYYHY
jgi:peptide/nickel transport system substrate-binding protein